MGDFGFLGFSLCGFVGDCVDVFAGDEVWWCASTEVGDWGVDVFAFNYG